MSVVGFLRHVLIICQEFFHQASSSMFHFKIGQQIQRVYVQMWSDNLTVMCIYDVAVAILKEETHDLTTPYQ